MDQERSEEIVTLKCLSCSTCLMGVPSMQTDNLGKEIFVGNDHEFGFGRISESQFVTMLMSNWMSMAS